MNLIQHMKELGEEKLTIELIYLQLKIEKALQGEFFKNEHLLTQSQRLFEQASDEYFAFMRILQRNNGMAA